MGRIFQLLRNCRSQLTDEGRVLVIEAIIQPGNAPDPIKGQDVGMMLLTRGRERTVDEYTALFDQAGLELKAVHATREPARVAIIEAAGR